MSFISLPFAPAFILTAPPIVPGIPAISSKPVKLSLKKTIPTLAIFSPAPNFILVFWPINLLFKFSSVSSNSVFSILIISVIPEIPLSNIKTLLPFPKTVNFILFSFVNFRISFNSFMFSIFIRHSAGPPTLNVVYFFIGSLYNIFSFDMFKSDFSINSFMLIFQLPLT